MPSAKRPLYIVSYQVTRGDWNIRLVAGSTFDEDEALEIIGEAFKKGGQVVIDAYEGTL